MSGSGEHNIHFALCDGSIQLSVAIEGQRNRMSQCGFKIGGEWLPLQHLLGLGAISEYAKSQRGESLRGDCRANNQQQGNGDNEALHAAILDSDEKYPSWS